MASPVNESVQRFSILNDFSYGRAHVLAIRTKQTLLLYEDRMVIHSQRAAEHAQVQLNYRAISDALVCSKTTRHAGKAARSASTPCGVARVPLKRTCLS